MSSSSNDTLRKVRKALRKYPQLTLSIEGHTDDVGKGSEILFCLKTEHWLLKNGSLKKELRRKDISSIGFGPDKPVGDNETEEGRTENRRVEMLYRMNVTDDETDRADGKDKNAQENSDTER